MSEVNDFSLLRSSFLEMFPEDCRQGCLVAMASAANAARQTIEIGVTYDKVSEVLAHRFGRCAIGPNTIGRCGDKQKICNNDTLEGAESYEAVDILSTL